MTSKFCLSLLCMLLTLKAGLCQGNKAITKSWIKREIYDLSNNQNADDTIPRVVDQLDGEPVYEANRRTYNSVIKKTYIARSI